METERAGCRICSCDHCYLRGAHCDVWFASSSICRPRLAYLVCPDPIAEGNTGQVGIRRSGYKIKSAYFFTDHKYYTAESDDYEEFHGLKVESNAAATTLRAPVVTKEDTVPEHDETFAIGYWDGGEWHHCVVTIEDDDAPGITLVEISSTPVDGYAYRAGEAIDVVVNLDSKVDVVGTPLLALFFGDGDESTWRGASYHSGSGSHSLVFRYQVQPEDLDNDGITVGAAAVNDDHGPAYGFSGNIYAGGTEVPINYAHPGVNSHWRQKVDGRPYVQTARITTSPPDGWKAYRAYQAIDVSMTFDTDVVVEGDVTIDLHLGLDNYNWDEATRRAEYIRGSGSDTLVFSYVVTPGDMDLEGVGLQLGGLGAGFGGEGTIKAKGTEVERSPWFLGTGHQPEHKVDTEPPDISSVSIVPSPSDGDAYGAGELIRAEVTFSEMITPSGDLQFELDVGGTERQASLGYTPERTFTKSLVFAYEVLDGDVDTDGVGIRANSLRLNGGGIYDIAGNAAGLSHPALAANPGQKVDA